MYFSLLLYYVYRRRKSFCLFFFSFIYTFILNLSYLILKIASNKTIAYGRYMCTSRLLKWLWLLLAIFFCLFTGIPNLDALHAEYYEDPQRTTMTICTTYCCILWYSCGIYCYIQLLLLYISLYLYYIWYRFSCLSKSILLFEEMAKHQHHPLHWFSVV